MDCRLYAAHPTASTISFSKALSTGLGPGFGNNACAGISVKPARLVLCIRNAIQEEEGQKSRQVLSTATVFKVAGVAATVAALIFTLPLPTPTRKGKEHEAPEKATGMERLKVPERDKKQKRVEEKSTMPLDERIQWTQGLPMVKDTIGYTDIFGLHQEGRIKHIIKHPHPVLQKRPQVVLLVLNDDRVVRSVLPAVDRDAHFWSSWKSLKLDSFVVNAFTPPPPKPEAPWKGINLPFWTQVQIKPSKKAPLKPQKKSQAPTSKAQKSPASARIEELEKARKDLERARSARDLELRKQKLEKVQAEKDAKMRILQQKELEEREKKLAEAKQAESEKLVQQQEAAQSWELFWDTAARSEGFRFMLGLFFFWLFYQTVVLGVKKRRKDYEDRLKIEQAEAEERRKMEDLEDETDLAEATSLSKEWNEEMNEEAKRQKEADDQNVQLQMGLRFMRSGARVRRAKGKRPPKYLDADADVRFEDVAGLGDIRRELEEIVDFFKYKEKYLRRGTRIPSGILLCGEPGTGKTLLAKAVAGEAGVNFFSISASQFVEIYVGVGASRVRALYQEAKENAPAVVFIDELDAVGRQRGLIGGSGGQERDATLNQLLTCLDGFEGKGDVITVAATNRVDILDRALIRPGRFDRKIFIPKPGPRGRIEILKVHARDKPIADDMDYEAVASVTDGMVGAQLANLLDVAALTVLREGRTEITTEDLLEAASLEEGGHTDHKPRSEELLHKMALNEAALAVAGANFPEFKNIQTITVVPRSGEDKGSVRSRVDSTKFLMSALSRQEVMDYITLQLAPRAADELVFGRDQLSTIWADHYHNARRVARHYVFYGLSERKEVYGMAHCWSELDRYYQVDREARKILEQCYSRAQKIIDKNQVLLKELTAALMDKKVLKKDDFWELADQYGDFEEPPPRLTEVRQKRLEEFREQMIMEKRAVLPS